MSANGPARDAIDREAIMEAAIAYAMAEINVTIAIYHPRAIEPSLKDAQAVRNAAIDELHRVTYWIQEGRR